LNNNIQILYGKAVDVRQTLQLINVIDTPSMEKKTPYLLEFENIEVQKFKSRMESILKNNSIPLADSIKDVGIVLNPIDELNALLVLTPKKSWLDMVVFWKNKLDIISEVSDTPQLYMYKVKYRKADEFASVLQTALPRTIARVPSLRNQNIVASQTSSRSGENSSISANGIASNQLNFQNSMNSLQIKADLHTNSLMMHLTSSQYKQILPIIKKLDKLPLQVLVEVTLAEVDITNNFNLGFEWSLLNNKALAAAGTVPLDGAHTLTLGGAKGITSTLFKTNLTSLINAFAEDKVLDILSRPSLMILNNKTGNINVGQQVPVISSEVSSNDVSSNTSTPSILRNISYTSTGITVNLTPTINSNGTLTLDIGITLSEAQSNKTSSIDSPLIINRQLTTSIVMHSDDSVLLGGLISHNFSNGDTGVPVLKELPLIGDLFKSQSKAHRKTELIILIHPKIIKNRSELNNETEKFKLLLKNLKKL
jgi:general secretion pathway protein D